MLATAIRSKPNKVGRGPSPLERYVSTARQAGCPADQIRNFAEAGVVLQPRQLSASAAARECDRPGGPTEVGFGGARGGGKSHWNLEQIGADDCQRQPELKCLILRNVGKAVRESFEDLLPRTLGGLHYRYVRSNASLHFPRNGSRIVLGHFKNESDIDEYLGLEYDVIGLEEANLLSLSKVRAIRTCNRTSKPDWRPRMYLTFNPGGIGHAHVKARFVDPHRRHKESETRFVPATVDDNQFVNVDYRRNLDALTGWQKRAWRYGDFDIAAGQFFTTWVREQHVVKPFDIPRDWRVWLAMDYGFMHWNTVYLLAESNDGTVFIMDEHAERRWLVERHVAAIDQMLERNHITRNRLETFVAGGDVFKTDTDGLTLSTRYAEHGYQLAMANTDRIDGAAEMLARLGDVENGIAPKLFITERCGRLIECMPALQHDPHRPEDVLKVDTDEDGNGGDDPYDGARYGLMVAARRATSFAMSYIR